MRLLALLSLATGCFDPTYAPHLGCSSSGTCPPGQHCLGDPKTNGVCAFAAVKAASCNVVDQTGCDTAEKCTQFGDVLVCGPEGSRRDGESCDRTSLVDDCAAGLICFFSVCHRFCDQTRTDQCADQTCRFYDTNIGVCE